MQGIRFLVNLFKYRNCQLALYAEAVVAYPRRQCFNMDSRILNNVTTTKLSIPSYSVASDNINEDGIPNPGENVRYIFSLKNNSSFAFSNLTMHAAPGPAVQYLNVASLSGNATYSLSYDQNNPATYLAFDVPKGLPRFDNNNFALRLQIRTTINGSIRLFFP